MPADPTLEKCLVALRLSLAGFLAIWAFDKILNGSGALKTFTKYYGSLPEGSLIVVIGLLQLVLIIAFAAGAFRTLTYGAVLAMHTLSVGASWWRYADPFARPNILFWAGIPVLVAFAVLFVLRHRDRMWAFDERS